MRRAFQGRAGMALAFILGLVVATAGTATAAKLITGKQIKNGSISAKDLSKAVQAQLKKAGVPGAQGAPGAVGPKGADGAAGAAGPPGSARAYAYVDPAACTPFVPCVISKSRNIAGVLGTGLVGVYCVTPTAGAGIDPATQVAIAGVDAAHTAVPLGEASATINSVNANCGQGQFVVVTQRLDSGTPSNTVGFWFAVL